MKTLNSVLSLTVMGLALAGSAQADVLVNTGAPNFTGFPLALNSGEWLAAEFTTTQVEEITDINAYIQADSGNPDNASFHISIYGNTGNAPDLSNQLFSQQASYSADGWNGLSGLTTVLNAGSYWVALEVSGSDTLQGLLPVYVANPAQGVAWDDPSTTYGYHAASGNAFNFGVQINAVPVPGSVWLFGTALLALGRFGKRKAV